MYREGRLTGIQLQALQARVHHPILRYFNGSRSVLLHQVGSADPPAIMSFEEFQQRSEQVRRIEVNVETVPNQSNRVASRYLHPNPMPPAE
eukprot:1788268-Pyramimonas_sp.AAC.1